MRDVLFSNKNLSTAFKFLLNYYFSVGLTHSEHHISDMHLPTAAPGMPGFHVLTPFSRVILKDILVLMKLSQLRTCSNWINVFLYTFNKLICKNENDKLGITNGGTLIYLFV